MTTSSSASIKAHDSLHKTCICSKKFMIKLRAKSKYFFEEDIIRHLLWGRHEINIAFLNLGQLLALLLLLHFQFCTFFATLFELKCSSFVLCWKKLVNYLKIDFLHFSNSPNLIWQGYTQLIIIWPIPFCQNSWCSRAGDLFTLCPTVGKKWIK